MRNFITAIMASAALIFTAACGDTEDSEDSSVENTEDVENVDCLDNVEEDEPLVEGDTPSTDNQLSN